VTSNYLIAELDGTIYNLETGYKRGHITAMPIENTNSTIQSTIFVNEYVIETLNEALNSSPFTYWNTFFLLEFKIYAKGIANVLYGANLGIFIFSTCEISFLFGLYTFTSEFNA